MTHDLFAPDALTLGDYAERAYLDYAVSVVKGRALPDVSDGQKPVQRRILYAMHDMNLDYTGTHGAKAVKSARVVGDVLGKFHPHGDQSAYDALVRLAQDFAMRYPLIDGQGNFGSRDGDGAAAMRYTEARLAPIARLLLDELDEGTVEFQPNYDGSTREPKLLPARLPFVLLNGASGIAVGMATEIPSHNLGEVARAAVAMLKSDGRADVDAMLEHIQGPDFPGGGQIISSAAEIAEVYRTGRGSIKVRARWKIEELARGQWQLVVTELPPQASAQRIGEEIEELTNPKVRIGKKALSPEQIQTRQLILSMLDRHRDESDKDARVRYVFEPKSRTVDQGEFITTLLAHTSLESSAPVNLVMIGTDGRPQQKDLAQILREWIEFRRHSVTRRTEHRLRKTRERIHVLEGRLLVLLNVDRVISVIREADEPKAALMAQFNLSERQADDVLEIRLRQLARLEGIAIERELADKRADAGKLEELLASPAAMKRLLIREIEADEKAFGDARRTLIREDRRAVLEVKVLDEPVTVVVSEKGWVRARSGHGHEALQFSFKAGDALYGLFECRTVDTLIAFGSNGRVYSTGVAQLPGARGDGAPITSLIEVEPGTRILHFSAGGLETPLLLATSAGNGLFCKLGDLVSRNRAGKAFLALDDAALPLRPEVVDPAEHRRIACLSGNGRLLVFGPSEVKFQAGGGRGVMLQRLDAGEKLLVALPIGARGLIVAGQSKSGKEATQLLSGAALDAYASERARKGRKVAARFVPARLARNESGGARDMPRENPS